MRNVLIVISIFLTVSVARSETVFLKQIKFRGQGQFQRNYEISNLPQGCYSSSMSECPSFFVLEGGVCYSEHLNSVVIYEIRCETSEANTIIENTTYEVTSFSTSSSQELIRLSEEYASSTYTEPFCPSGSIYLGSVHMYTLEGVSLSDTAYSGIVVAHDNASCRFGQGGSGTSSGQTQDDWDIGNFKNLITDIINRNIQEIRDNITVNYVEMSGTNSFQIFGRTVEIDFTKVPYLNEVINIVYYVIVTICSISIIKDV